ncbi:MAG: hypothetical protein ACR2PG_09530 [Hyphomicrobiaceae bacterium]
MAHIGPDIGRRMTSSLNEVKNDTGRIAYCGPYVVAAITGTAISRIEEEIRRIRDLPETAKVVVSGTFTTEIQAALETYGYEMLEIANYTHLPRKERPTLWTWMQKPRNAWTHYILGVHKGKEGHWIAVKGVKMCDTFTNGRWQFVCDGPHRGARIMEVFAVKRRLA